MISASIVLYNNEIEEVENIINNINKSKLIYKIFLIDNSPDTKLDILKQYSKNVIYIKNKNTGYGSSHNIALRRSIKLKSDYHIVLNADISFEENVISELKEYMDQNKDIVYILPKVLNKNGKIQYLCKLLPTPFNLIFRRFFPNVNYFRKINDKYILKKSGYNKIINPPCLSGCFMFLRLAAINEYNIFFDERFFLYCEDFDIIRRLHRIGKTIFYPYVSIIHNHNKESYRSKKMLFEHIKSSIKYFNKYGWFFDIERKNMNNKILDEIKYL